MKITLDPEACVGHGRCYALAPAVFAPDDLGHCEVIEPEPSGALQAKARLGVQSCPELALSIEE